MTEKFYDKHEQSRQRRQNHFQHCRNYVDVPIKSQNLKEGLSLVRIFGHDLE